MRVESKFQAELDPLNESERLSFCHFVETSLTPGFRSRS